MAGWSKHKGTAVALPQANIDTDQLIPARFMSVPRSAGYGAYLLHDQRRDAAGALLPDFPLNRHPDASILVAGPNFGSGSSREAAVYALVDAGFKVVAAASFGDIFANNAINNGLLPAVLSDQDAEVAIQAISMEPAAASVDLMQGRLVLAGQTFRFDLDEASLKKMSSGWDDIDLTFQQCGAIKAYRAEQITQSPRRVPRV